MRTEDGVYRRSGGGADEKVEGEEGSRYYYSMDEGWRERRERGREGYGLNVEGIWRNERRIKT